MSKDQSDRNAEAAQWLDLRIKALIKETERQFGVYVYKNVDFSYARDGYHVLSMALHVWPAAMRIIETERESKAIG